MLVQMKIQKPSLEFIDFERLSTPPVSVAGYIEAVKNNAVDAYITATLLSGEERQAEEVSNLHDVLVGEISLIENCEYVILIPLRDIRSTEKLRFDLHYGTLTSTVETEGNLLHQVCCSYLVMPCVGVKELSVIFRAKEPFANWVDMTTSEDIKNTIRAYGDKLNKLLNDNYGIPLPPCYEYQSFIYGQAHYADDNTFTHAYKRALNMAESYVTDIRQTNFVIPVVLSRYFGWANDNKYMLGAIYSSVIDLELVAGERDKLHLYKNTPCIGLLVGNKQDCTLRLLF